MSSHPVYSHRGGFLGRAPLWSRPDNLGSRLTSEKKIRGLISILFVKGALCISRIYIYIYMFISAGTTTAMTWRCRGGRGWRDWLIELIFLPGSYNAPNFMTRYWISIWEGTYPYIYIYTSKRKRRTGT